MSPEWPTWRRWTVSSGQRPEPIYDFLGLRPQKGPAVKATPRRRLVLALVGRFAVIVGEVHTLFREQEGW
jgi:hypothetical protein